MRLFLPLCAAILAGPLLEAQLAINSRPARVLGHVQRTLVTVSPNLVEGRELNNPYSAAIDANAPTPILYVADTFNNRVLVWRDAATAASGAKADYVVGQRDLCSTLPHGQGDLDLAFGLTGPTGVAVDATGRVYVADAGNNRILRYPRPPFDMVGGACAGPRDPHLPTLVIGQPDFAHRYRNGEAGTPAANTLATATAQSVPYATALAFDTSGALWFTDAANNRVLRYAAAVLESNGPAADLIIGQGTINTFDPSKPEFFTNLNQPAGLVFDQSGNLFVSDALGRVLVFTTAGVPLKRYIGVRPGDTTTLSDHGLTSPNGLFTIGDALYVVDTGANRILRFDPYAQWPADKTPSATVVLGQASMTEGKANRGLPLPTQTTLFAPVAAAYLAATGDLFIVDSANSRVLVSKADVLAGMRVLGQTNVYYNAPNLIEGREFQFSFPTNPGAAVQTLTNQGTVAQAAIAIDGTAQPPRLYISDPGNNRVLGFRDARKVKPGDIADIVIGQPDMLQSRRNFPANDATKPNEFGLNRPAGLAVDAAGDLYVADMGNGRVLRFHKPFDEPNRKSCEGDSMCMAADLVLGQTSLTSVNRGVPTSSLMANPYGLAFTSAGHLLVSDVTHNRVLLFAKPAGGDFSNGMQAAYVIGQPDFASTTAGTAPNRFFGPRGIAVDATDRLYVADAQCDNARTTCTAMGRVSVFSDLAARVVDPTPRASVRNLNAPFGVFVNKQSGEIWIVDTQNNRTIRYRDFETLSACLNSDCEENPVPAAAEQRSSPQPLAVAQDPGGPLYIADAAHRVAMYYPLVVAANTASGANRLAPGLIASVFVQQKLVDTTQAFSGLPVPTTLPADTGYQVLVNGVPAPVFAIAPVSFTPWQTQINFMIPIGSPATGQAEFVVARPSTGEILGSNSLAMDVASPALFSTNQAGSGQAAALNWPEYTVNSASNPIARGKYIMLFGTGQGFVQGAPEDGQAPTGPVPAETPRVFVGSRWLDASDVQYSGLAPGLVGVWQINARIPDWVGVASAQPVVVQFRDITTNAVSIAVK